MADSKISALSALSVPALTDYLEVLDVSDTSMAATGTNTKGTIDRLLALVGGAPQLRLTTEAGVPVSPSNRTAQSTLRAVTCLPGGIYTGGIGFATTWDGTRRRIQQVGDISAALTLTADKLYDVFLKNSDLSLVFSTAWTNDTARADALATAGGLPVANADNTYLWLGTIRASGTNVIEHSYAKRFVWNAHNQVYLPMAVLPTADSWTYATATYRQANADAANQLDFVVGATTLVSAEVNVHVASPASDDGGVAIGLDSTTAPSVTSATGGYASAVGAGSTVSNAQWCRPRTDLLITAGRHTLVWLEVALNGTLTMNGDAGGYGTNIAQAGISGRLMG